MTPLELAALLHAAARDRAPIEPLTDAFELELERAYAAQWLLVQERLAAGERLVGAKLGLTSRAKQEAMGVADPLYGWLTGGMLHPSEDPLPLEQLIHPRVEPEIAFVLERTPAYPASVPEVLDATRYVTAALEVIDSRYRDFRFRLPDVVADNASAARVVLGSRAIAPADAGDLRLTGCVLRAGGEVVATAAGAAVMGHPAAAVAWLSDRLHERGLPLAPGALVLSGGLTNAVPIGTGGVVRVDLDGLGCAEVRA